MIFKPAHPLAMKNGYVYEHRIVVYDKYGADLPKCEFCDNELTWENCHIDHINNDITDNQLQNLRPICRACNVMRKHTKIPRHTHKGCHAITYKEITMTPTEWARQPNVTVSRRSILNRINKGWSVEEALFTPSKTHPNSIIKNREPIYKNDFELNAGGIDVD